MVTFDVISIVKASCSIVTKKAILPQFGSISTSVRFHESPVIAPLSKSDPFNIYQEPMTLRSVSSTRTFLSLNKLRVHFSLIQKKSRG